METVTLTINGVSVEADKEATILGAAQQAGIYIPALCAHPALSSSLGQCRLCVVEVEGGGFPSSCITPVAQGMVVNTESPQLQAMRRHFLKAVLSPLPSPRLRSAELKALADYIGVKEDEFGPSVPKDLPIEQDDPLFVRDYNLCILCGRCVRVCEEVRGVGAISVVGYDDIPLAEHAQPPLTTLRQPIYEIGRRICEMLISLLQEKPLKERHVILKPQLVVRESCGSTIRQA